MGNISVLVNSPDATMVCSLHTALLPSGVRVVGSQPGVPFMLAARRERPRIAVLDRVDERADAAAMEIELLKELCPDVRIIVVSRNPSADDASFVERRVFFYMATPADTELVRVIQAAAGLPAGAPSGSAASQSGAPDKPNSTRSPECTP